MTDEEPGGAGRTRTGIGSPLAEVRSGRLADVALAGLVLLLAGVLPALIGFHYPGSRPIAQFLTTTLMVAPLALRSTRPFLMLALSTLGGVLHLFVSPGPLPGLIAVPLIVYSVAREVGARQSRWALAVGLPASVIGPLDWWWINDWEFNFGVIVMLACTGLVLTPYVIGRRLRETEEAKDAAVRFEAEQDQIRLVDAEHRARMAEIDARQRIARELHDIVAHSLSVMVVQAEGGRALAARKPERAAEVLETIATTGRDALVEMRRIVGVLRSEPGEAAYAPMPALGDIADMVARTGDRVEHHVIGHPPSCSAATQLTVYRVVQEALTNFLKHAGPHARAVVTLSYSAEEITAEIIDDGLGAWSFSDGHGSGLRGMRERVSAMGGSLVVGPRPEGGFGVRATVPVVPTRPTHAPPEPDEGDR